MAKRRQPRLTAQEYLSVGKWLRQKYQNAANFECIPLIFGDLEVGEKFIAFPLPGDNGGHEGLQGSFHLFVKTQTVIHPEEPSNSVRINDGTHHHFKNDLLVVRIQ